MIRRFNRYELKYILPVGKMKNIVHDLKEMTEPDPHGGLDGYQVLSLYYDSPGLDFFWAKVEGIKFRRKLRLRIYPQAGLDSVKTGMVEIKQRINRTVQKRRVRLGLTEAERLCRADDVEDQESFSNLDRQVISEVQYLVRAMHLQPTCIIRYHRQAFVGGRYDAGLRITFDTELVAREHALSVTKDANNHRFVSPDYGIMEVKVNELVPDWVSSLLARYNCQLHRVSKYCTGLAIVRQIRVLPMVITPTHVVEEFQHG